MASTPAFRDRVLTRLLPFGPVAARAMFGGYGLYLDGVMFGLIATDRLYFKVDGSNRAEFVAAGSRPFTYRGRTGPVELSYWEVPAAVFAAPLQLAEWAARAHRAARAARPGPRKRATP